MAKVTELLTTLVLFASVSLMGASQHRQTHKGQHQAYKGMELKVIDFEILPEWKPSSILGVVLTGKGVAEIAVVRLSIVKWVGNELTDRSLVSLELTLLDGTKVPCAHAGLGPIQEIDKDGKLKTVATPKPDEVLLDMLYGDEKCARLKCEKLEVPFVVPKGTTRLGAIRFGDVSFDLKNLVKAPK